MIFIKRDVWIAQVQLHSLMGSNVWHAQQIRYIIQIQKSVNLVLVVELWTQILEHANAPLIHFGLDLLAYNAIILNILTLHLKDA